MKHDQKARNAHLAQLAGPLARFMRKSDVNTAREAVEAGNRLLLLKGTLHHGEWLPRLEQLDISQSRAAKLMACARRFSHRPDALFDAVGSAGKLTELLTLDEEEIDVLCNGGDIEGVALRDLEAMTVLELRAALRQRYHSAKPEQPALQLVQRVHPVFEVEDATIVRSDTDDLDNDAPQLSVAEEVLLRHWRRCDKQGRKAISDVACALSVATLKTQQ